MGKSVAAVNKIKICCRDQNVISTSYQCWKFIGKMHGYPMKMKIPELTEMLLLGLLNDDVGVLRTSNPRMATLKCNNFNMKTGCTDFLSRIGIFDFPEM